MIVYNEELFNSIYLKHSKTLLKYAYSFTKNNSDANDIVQNVFIKLYHLNKPLKEEEVLYWLLRVTKNESINFLKSYNKKNVVLNNDFTENLESKTEEEKDYSIVIESLDKLKMKDREVLTLYYFNNLSNKEIAAVVGRSAEQVKKQIQRARLKLKKLVEKAYEQN